MTAADKDGWITRKPSDPIPSGNVRIRNEDGWESRSFAPASMWLGWDTPGVIVAYLPESPPQETEADRLARCAPQLVEALRSILVFAQDSIDQDPTPRAVLGNLFGIRDTVVQALQALSEAGIEL